MRRWLTIRLVLAVNTAAGLVPAVMLALFNHGGWGYFGRMLTDSMVFSFCIGSIIFAAMYYLGPRFDRLSTIAHWIAELATFAVLAAAGTGLGEAILAHMCRSIGGTRGSPFMPVFVEAVRPAIAMTLVAGPAVSYLLTQSRRLRAATLELRTRQLNEERARKLAAEARLAELKSKVHPHFLFNSLNSIAALIREDPAGAERMTEKLAGLMRQALDADGSALAPVSQELRLVQDYLEIEKTRFGERLRYSVEAPEQMSDAEVPPLALQTLVENSVKYAVAPRREGGEICVNARMEGDCAVLEVSDDGPGFEASALKPDHGLQNLRERLAALLDVAGSLEIARRERRMVVTVRVPQGKGRPA